MSGVKALGPKKEDLRNCPTEKPLTSAAAAGGSAERSAVGSVRAAAAAWSSASKPERPTARVVTT